MSEEDFGDGTVFLQHILEIGVISLPVLFGMNGFAAALVLANWRFKLEIGPPPAR